MEQSSDYSPVQSSKYQSENSQRNSRAVLDNIVMKEGDWYIVKFANYKKKYCCFSTFNCLRRCIKACCFWKEWKMVFVKITDDQTKIRLSIDQKSLQEIDLKEAIGVHYDRQAECTNLILKDSNLIVFKGFCEKDLLNLRNSIQFCLNNFDSKTRYKHTAEDDLDISEFILKFDKANEFKNDKVVKLVNILTKFQIKFAFLQIKINREEVKLNDENVNLNNIVLEIDMQGSHGQEGEDSALQSQDVQPAHDNSPKKQR